MIGISRDTLAIERTGRILADQGDVPSVAVDSRGCVYVYYVSWGPPPSPGQETTQNKNIVAISADDGLTWTYKRVVLSGFGSPPNTYAPPVDPAIVILENGTFRLYLTSAPPEDMRNPRTYYAEGTDGVHFTRKGVAFQAPPGFQALDPSVLKVGEERWIYFSGGGGPGANWRGRSTDGTSFVEIMGSGRGGTWEYVVEGKKQLFSNGVAVATGGYRYFTFDDGTPQSIRSFFSTDGLNWTADPGARLSVDPSNGLESTLVKDSAMARLSNGSYIFVYVTKIPGS